MKQFLVTTGLGYFSNPAGNPVAKYILPIGFHNIKDDFDAVEVEDQAEFDSIEIFEAMVINPAYVEQEKLIADKMRLLAIDALKKDGKTIDPAMQPMIEAAPVVKKSLFSRVLNYLNPFA